MPDMNNKYVYPNVFMNQEDSEKLANLQTDISTYIKQKRADWIMNGGVEEQWDDHLAELEAYGLEEYLEILQKYFDSNGIK